VFLLDPSSEDVVPVVRELLRKLSTIDTNLGDDDQVNSPLEIEVDEVDGMIDHNYTSFFLFKELYIIIFN
jgi:hypothetical protein